MGYAKVSVHFLRSGNFSNIDIVMEFHIIGIRVEEIKQIISLPSITVIFILVSNKGLDKFMNNQNSWTKMFKYWEYPDKILHFSLTQDRLNTFKPWDIGQVSELR